MSVDITKFAVAVQNWFVRCGVVTLLISQQCCNATKLIIVNIITIVIINILTHTVFQLQSILNNNLKFTYFSL
jgi:hypothetical protein